MPFLPRSALAAGAGGCAAGAGALGWAGFADCTADGGAWMALEPPAASSGRLGSAPVVGSLLASIHAVICTPAQ